MTNDQAKNDKNYVEIKIEHAIMRVDIADAKNNLADSGVFCDCPSCRNYYKAIRTKPNLLTFLDLFGIDADRPEELYGWSDDAAKTLTYNAWYAVSGEFAGDKILINIDGIEIGLFSNTADTEKNTPFFWLNIKDIRLPWLLHESMYED